MKKYRAIRIPKTDSRYREVTIVDLLTDYSKKGYRVVGMNETLILIEKDIVEEEKKERSHIT
jgi:hypothetical protein